MQECTSSHRYQAEFAFGAPEPDLDVLMFFSMSQRHKFHVMIETSLELKLCV
jgi:hypothetical protein